MDEALQQILKDVTTHTPYGMAVMAPFEELTGNDYLNKPMTELLNHPDFSPQAMHAVATISTMTSAQLESINFRGEN